QPCDGEPEDIKGVECVLKRLRRSRERLIDAYQEEIIDKEDFAARHNTLKERIKRLEESLSEARRDASTAAELRLAVTNFEEFAARVDEGLDGADWRARRTLIRAIVKEIVVDPEEVKIVYRVLPLPFVEAPCGGQLQLGSRRAGTGTGTGSVAEAEVRTGAEGDGEAWAGA